MRISDWSSDVCSSDLLRLGLDAKLFLRLGLDPTLLRRLGLDQTLFRRLGLDAPLLLGLSLDASLPRRLSPIGRASCRERVCPDVYIAVVAVTLKKKTTSSQHT